MNTKIKSIICFVICMILGFGMIGCSSKDEKETSNTEKVQKTVTIVDNVGRTVEVPFPLERAAVALRYNNELIRACGAIDQVIAVDMNTAQDREYWSNFDPEQTIGKSQKELNYEKIIELNPQALILPSNGAYEEAEEKLKPFGIPVIVISGYDTNDFENQVRNIGKIFDKEKEAEKFMAFYKEPLDYIQKKLEGVPKRTVYWESTKDYHTSFEGDYYYNMIKFSGGKNIFEDAPENVNGQEINPEEVITKNPDVIVKNITPQTALKGTGVYIPPQKEQMKETIDTIKNRPGWDEMNAVKNDDIYLMTQFGHGGASKMIGAVYMAKWTYPDILSDLDPDEIFREWLEDYQGFKYVDGHFYPKTK